MAKEKEKYLGQDIQAEVLFLSQYPNEVLAAALLFYIANSLTIEDIGAEEEVSGEESKILPKGSYRLTQDVFAGNKGEIRGKKGDVILVFADTSPTGEVIGLSIFKVVHQKSKEEIFVALEDLKEK